MKPISKIVTLENASYFALLLAGLIFVLNSRPVFYPDTWGYIYMTINRSVGYSLFAGGYKAIFGNAFIVAMMISQMIINLLSCFFVMGCIRKSIGLNRMFSAILLFVLIIPVFMGMKLAVLILSESLAYPLYLLVIGQLLLGLKTKNHKHFYYAFGFSFLAILVRGQFLFLIPVLLIVIVLAYHKFLLSKKVLLLFATVIAIPFLATLTDMGYHKIKHNRAVATPWTGIQLIAMPFYVSDEKDAAIFKNDAERAYFTQVYAKLKEKKLLASQVPPPIKKIDFFFDKYTEICNRTIHRDGIETFPKNLPQGDRLIANNDRTIAMTLPLLKDNFGKWFSVYERNFTKGFDTGKYFLLYLLLLILSAVTWFRKKNPLSEFIILIVLFTIANVALVAIVESTIVRYTFYNNWVLIAIVLVLFQHYFYNKTNE